MSGKHLLESRKGHVRFWPSRTSDLALEVELPGLVFKNSALVATATTLFVTEGKLHKPFCGWLHLLQEPFCDSARHALLEFQRCPQAGEG